jgi:hypothetical protein
MRRAVGITSYYRVTPIHKPAKPRLREDKPLYVVKELPMTVDVRSLEVKRQEREDALIRSLTRMVDTVGWPVLKAAAVLLIVALIVNLGRYIWSLICV